MINKDLKDAALSSFLNILGTIVRNYFKKLKKKLYLLNET
jgi:hypothetical protein